MTEIDIREATEDDKPFIFSSWLNHYKNYSSFARRIRKSIFMDHHHLVIENALSRQSTFALVATPKSDPTVLLGFIVYEPGVVHFAYVKQAFQRLGIGKALLRATGLMEDDTRIEFTHWTYDMDRIEKKYPSLTYNPYKL